MSHIESQHNVHNYKEAKFNNRSLPRHLLHPSVALATVEDMMANGTARGAFLASSLMCTLVSKPAKIDRNRVMCRVF